MAVSTHRCSNPQHGVMVERPLERQSPEQRWCGRWFDCSDPHCRSSRLDRSAGLTAQLTAQAEARSLT